MGISGSAPIRVWYDSMAYEASRGRRHRDRGYPPARSVDRNPLRDPERQNRVLRRGWPFRFCSDRTSMKTAGQPRGGNDRRPVEMEARAANPLASARRSRHFGLPGMRERAATVSGQLDVRSERGAGTAIKLRVPWRTAYRAAGPSSST
jgi:hypothetical protein